MNSNAHTQTLEEAPRSAGQELRRRARGRAASMVLLAIATIGAVLGVGASAASAAPASTAGSYGYYSASTCNYYNQAGGITALYDYRISYAYLPSVSARTSSQRVWVFMEFQHPSGNTLQTYRSGWFYVDAVAGRATNYWTSYTYKTAPWTWEHDAAGESGLTNGGVPVETYVKFTIDWMTGSAITGQVVEYATNPHNVGNSFACNAGGQS